MPIPKTEVRRGVHLIILRSTNNTTDSEAPVGGLLGLSKKKGPPFRTAPPFVPMSPYARARSASMAWSMSIIF